MKHILLSLMTAASMLAADKHWPEFRGPHGDGLSSATKLPLKWSEQQNVAWKTAIHDKGWSSPVIWGDQVWVTTATDDGRRLYALCLDRDSGTVSYTHLTLPTKRIV